MFWNRKLGSDEYLKLLKSFEELRIRFEGLVIEFDLIKRKLRIKKGLVEETETETNKNSTIFLNPDGTNLKSN